MKTHISQCNRYPATIIRDINKLSKERNPPSNVLKV